jgi:hypothetical protein
VEKKQMKIFGGIILTVVISLSLFNCNQQTYTVEGWEHGVVICDNAVIINIGHTNDKEVVELLSLIDKCK